MNLDRVFAHLSCSNLDRSVAWFERLFDRAPDQLPMTTLAEWHHGATAGLQLFRNPADAGHGTLTLMVGDVEAERDRVERAGLAPGDLEEASYTRLVRLRDPDGNLVVLAQAA